MAPPISAILALNTATMDGASQFETANTP